VNAEPALFYDPLDLREPDFSTVIVFQGTPRHKAEIVDGEYYAIENRPVTPI
jgi:hypothetical protein